MKYEVVFPCVVRAADGKGMVDHRRVGEVIDADPASAERLVKSGHLKPVRPKVAAVQSDPVQPKSDKPKG